MASPFRIQCPDSCIGTKGLDVVRHFFVMPTMLLILLLYLRRTPWSYLIRAAYLFVAVLEFFDEFWVRFARLSTFISELCSNIVVRYRRSAAVRVHRRPRLRLSKTHIRHMNIFWWRVPTDPGESVDGLKTPARAPFSLSFATG